MVLTDLMELAVNHDVIRTGIVSLGGYAIGMWHTNHEQRAGELSRGLQSIF